MTGNDRPLIARLRNFRDTVATRPRLQRPQGEGSAEAKERAEPSGLKHDIVKLRNDFLEGLLLLAYVLIHSLIFIGWFAILYGTAWVINHIGHLDYPYNIIPDIAELIVEFAVLCGVAAQARRVISRFARDNHDEPQLAAPTAPNPKARTFR
jgi:hypothetical protein